MSEFLSYARDVLTVIIIGGFMLWCALHEFVAFVRSLFANSKCPSVTPVMPKKKFNGSAATYVR